jgi:hypothetical protein
MPLRSHLLSFLAAVAGLTPACDSMDTRGSCLENVLPALVLEIRDSVTGAPAALGAIPLVTDGSFQDTLRMKGTIDSSNAYVSGPDERAGTYSIQVAKPSYLTWTRADVQVTRGACHVNPVQLLVRLAPEGL